MGKQRIQELLGRLEENHRRDIENSASIYTVAQVAVNQLDKATQSIQNYQENVALPPAPPELSKEELQRRYKNYNGCRRAAINLGIRFSKTPSWEKLVCAFSYAEALRQLSHLYVKTYPSPLLKGVKIELDMPD
jgi:hypothetical protein